MIQRNQAGYRVGQSHHRAKLPDAKVIAMRADHAAGRGGYGALAKRYGCSESTARDICTYRTRYQVSAAAGAAGMQA